MTLQILLILQDIFCEIVFDPGLTEYRVFCDTIHSIVQSFKKGNNEECIFRQSTVENRKSDFV